MHNSLDPILVRQHALVTRAQCWEANVSSRQIDRFLAQGLLLPVHRGVYRDPAAPVTLEQRALAAVLAGGRGAVASHRLAIALWGMPNYQCWLAEVTARGLTRRPGFVSHRSATVPPSALLRGVPVTVPARTIIDVATLVSDRMLSRWIETWLSTKTLRLPDLEAQMSASRGHLGVPIVGRCLGTRTLVHEAADSGPEAELGLLLAAHGLPLPTLHFVVTVATGSIFELDWCYPELRIAFEMDGYGVHLRSLEAFEHDRARRNELEIDGWRILNFTKRQVDTRPRFVVDQVRRMRDAATLRG